MSRVFIVSDIHGRSEPLLEALQRAKIVDKAGRRSLPKKDKVFSIGDLINSVKDSYIEDNECLDLVETGIIDGIIVGNHEMPYIDPANTFSGFHPYQHISDRIWNLVENDVIGPCVEHDETLITHAGMHRRWGFPNAKDAAQKLEYEWSQKNYSHFLFSVVGFARGGRDTFGGILWCDFDKELLSDFPQIVGHTPGILRYKPNALCIDVGAKNKGKPAVIELC